MLLNKNYLKLVIITPCCAFCLFILIKWDQVVDVLPYEFFNNLDDQRQLIRDEIENYELPAGKLLEELTPETGGNPWRSMIVTTWRSGSTFMGDILNAVPGNFFHFEPLIPFDGIRFRGPQDNDDIAIDFIKNLLNCDFRKVNATLFDHYKVKYYIRLNTRLSDFCESKNMTNECRDPKFLETFCKLFPMQSMKTVRLGLRSAAKLLKDER